MAHEFAPHGAFRRPIAKDVYGVNAETVIKRSDFGMTTFLPKIGDDVKLSIVLDAVQS